MRDRKKLVIFMGAFVLGVFIFALVNVGFRFTGFAVFEDSGTGFDNGNYVNTTYNGTGIVLVGNNLSGSYESQVFDAGAEANWNNLSWDYNLQTKENIYCVDGGGDVYKSSNEGVNWTLNQENYGRTSATTEMFSNSNYLYILSSNGNEVWRSSNGTDFILEYSGFDGKSPLVGDSDSDGNLYVSTGPGEVWKSEDDGLTWNLQGDFNSGANDPKGIAINSSNDIFAVDGKGDVYFSVDQGISWAMINDGYGGGSATDGLRVDSNGFLYILNNKGFYKSSDLGATWNLVNDSFTPYSNDGCDFFIDIEDNFFIVDCIGRVFKSDNSGDSWEEIGDCNSDASNNPKGITGFLRLTNLSFQTKNCTLSDCGDGTWQSVDLNNINLQGRYFQYKVDFTTEDSLITPELYNVSVDYDLLNTAPTISLDSPQDGAIYGYNESLNLSYNVSDIDGNLDSCWYNIDDGENISLVNCSDIVFSIANNGTYVLNLYANDSLGLKGNDSVSFSVINFVPLINIFSPEEDAVYDSNESLDLNFSVSDVDGNLDSCWYNVGGGNVSISGCLNTSFDVGGSGTYVLNLYANDRLGMEGSDLVSFSVDIEGVDVNVSEPSGEKDSRTGIEIIYDVSGENVSCWYNIETSIGGSVIGNTSLENCSSSSFDVSADGDYVLNLFVNNSYGSFASDSSNFSVDTSKGVVNSPSGGGSSGGGGGGGGSFVSVSITTLEIKPIDVIVSKGEERRLLVEVKNTGSTSVNKCGLVGGDFVDSDDIFNIGVGEIIEFNFVLRALDGVENFDLVLKCLDNVSEIVPLGVEILKPNLDVSILNIGFDADSLRVDYNIESTGDVEEELHFKILNSDGDVIKEVIENVSLAFGESYNGSVVVDVGDVEKGMLRVAISDGDVNFVEEDFVYGGGVGVTGFASLDWSGDFSYIGIILVVFLILAGLLIRRIWKLKKKRH